MFHKKNTAVALAADDPYGPAPHQMTLFPEASPGHQLEKLKINTLLKTFYKHASSADNHAELNSSQASCAGRG